MYIKKIIGIFAIAISLTACGQSTETNKGWKSLTENNYSIEYPSNWELDKSSQLGTKFILFSPLSSKNDKFKENVNLLIQDLKGYNIDLDKFVEISESQINTMMTDGKILESKRMTGEKFNYQKVIFTGKQGRFNFKFEQYYWVIGNKAFVLTLTCEENQFDKYQATGEKILKSFKLNNN